MRIRPFIPADGAALHDLYGRAVREIGARDYDAAQVAVWAALAPTADRFCAMAADGRTVLVAVDDGDCPLAFGDLEADGHIDFLYCAPEAAGTGVTESLYAALEASAREQGIASLYSEASELARRFFLKRGFVVERRRDFEVAGVPIHNYAVRKVLA